MKNVNMTVEIAAKILHSQDGTPIAKYVNVLTPLHARTFGTPRNVKKSRKKENATRKSPSDFAQRLVVTANQ